MSESNVVESELGWVARGRGGRGLLLLHGWMTTGAVWEPLLRELDTSALTCVVPDLRGVGLSAAMGGAHDLDTYARDVWRVVSAAGLERPILVGHSMGGQLAQRVAAEHSAACAGLVLINPVPASGLPLPPEALALFSSAGGDGAKLGTILDMACTALTPDARAHLLDVALAIAPETIRAMLSVWTTGGFEARLVDIRLPTLVVSTDDPFLPPDFLDGVVTSRIEGARREHLPGCGHYPLVERAAETAAILERFLLTLPA